MPDVLLVCMVTCTSAIALCLSYSCTGALCPHRDHGSCSGISVPDYATPILYILRSRRALIGTESPIIFIASVGKLEEAVIFRTLNGSSLPLL